MYRSFWYRKTGYFFPARKIFQFLVIKFWNRIPIETTQIHNTGTGLFTFHISLCPLPLMRKVKHCKVALMRRNIEIFPYFPWFVKLGEGSACESALFWCLSGSGSRSGIFGINWKFWSGSASKQCRSLTLGIGCIISFVLTWNMLRSACT